MPAGTENKIIRAAHGLEPPPNLEDLEKYINLEMPGEFFAMLSPVKCGSGKGKEISVCGPTGETVFRFYSCSPAANSLSTVKWIASQLEPKKKENQPGNEQILRENRTHPLHAHVEQRIREAAKGSAEPPGLRTMADFIDDHLDGCKTEMVNGQCGNGSVYLRVVKDNLTQFEFSTCLPGADMSKLAIWITRLLDEQQS